MRFLWRTVLAVAMLTPAAAAPAAEVVRFARTADGLTAAVDGRTTQWCTTVGR
jgi:hypothetical protein